MQKIISVYEALYETLRKKLEKPQVHWWIFGLFILLQYLLFRTYVERNVLTSYPPGHDQTGYLMQTYQLHSWMGQRGISEGLTKFFKEAVPIQGVLLQLQAGFLYLFFGAGRLTALTINFFYFALLQAFVFFGLRKSYGNWTLAYVAWGILTAFQSTYNTIGGMFDFRLDFVGFCLFGILIVQVLLSKTFALRRQIKWIVFTALILLFTRSIFFVYLCGISGGLLVSLLLKLALKKNHRKITILRLKNLGWTALGCILLFAPFLIFNWQRFYDYYGVGHLVGSERFIRAREVGVFSLKDSLLYYPNSLINFHIGKDILNSFLYVLAFLFGLTVLLRKGNLKKLYKNTEFLFFVLLAILVPIAILMSDVSKSPVVAMSLLGPILLLFAYSLNPLLKKSPSSVKVFVLIFFLVSGWEQVLHSYSKGDRGTINSSRQILKMYADIGDYFSRQGMQDVTLSINSIEDYLASCAISSVVYEKDRVFLNVINTPLGGTIFYITRDQILNSLQNSNLVLLSHNVLKSSNLPPYPFYDSMREHMPEIQAYVEKKYVFLNTYYLPDTDNVISVYVRPSMSFEGLTGDRWITDNGATVVLPAGSKGFEFLADFGTEDIARNFQAHARILEPVGNELPVEIKVEKNKSVARVIGHLVNPEVYSASAIKVGLKFSPYVVFPNDPRKLILLNPRSKKVYF